MPASAISRETVSQIRLAGWLYLIIIVCGLTAELGVRTQLVDPADAAGTAAAILARPGLFKLAIAADLVMAMADAGVAILLFLIFRSVAPGLALAAMVFRLIQTLIIAVNLMAMQAAWLTLAGGGPPQQALFLLDLHAHGYDLGLFFFAINSVLTGLLVWRSKLFGRVFGLGLMAAGLVYLGGSSLHFFAPEHLAAFTPAYGLTLLAELAFCLRLILQKRSA